MKGKHKHQQVGGEVTELATETAKVEPYWIVGDRPEPREPPRNYNYVEELINLQIELIKLQEYVRHNRLKMCIIFRGAGCSGQGWRHQAHYRSTEPPRLPRRCPRYSDGEGARAVVFPTICSGIAVGR